MNKLQLIISSVLQEMSNSTAGGVLGHPQQPSSVFSGDRYAVDPKTGASDARNIFGAYDTNKKERKPPKSHKMGTKKGKVKSLKPKTAKMFPVIKRTFPETFLGAR